MMKPLLPPALLGCLLLFCACETVRTVYDENGNVVDPDAPSGGEGDISSRLEKQFANSFSEKKNDQGVPQAVSNKVSRYQQDLDASSRLDKEYSAGRYAGAEGSYDSISFSDGKKIYGVKDAYTDAMGKRIDKDLHPAFAEASRGVYATEDSYSAAGAGARAYQEGAQSPLDGRSYATEESYYSRDMKSGYIESRIENARQPRVMTRDQYYRKSIDQTRALLGRDSDER